MTNQELEVKFYLRRMEDLKQKLEAQGAELVQERVLEVNLRFDTPDHKLAQNLQVLRLRMDTRARLTYKGPGQESEGVRQREELEFTVSDFDTARAFLEALGYVVELIYEKYRTTYDLGGTEVTLDEMPFGSFAEIEGPDGKTIQAVAQQLGLDWDTRIMDSYTALFARVKEVFDLRMRDLIFENFKGLDTPLEAIGLRYGEVA